MHQGEVRYNQSRIDLSRRALEKGLPLTPTMPEKYSSQGIQMTDRSIDSIDQSLDISVMSTNKLVDNKLISLSKSKEYARLSSNIPHLHSAQKRKNDDFKFSIMQGNTVQDKYQKNIKHLKLY